MSAPTDKELEKLGYKFLGWANGWSENPEELEKCHHFSHPYREISYSNRGLDHTVWCDICKFYYKYDSSG
jgi:hypothetical protein